MRTAAIVELGGPHLATAGVTSELVLPNAGALDVGQAPRLHRIRLDEAIARSDELIDAHLAIAVHRLAHADGRR